MQVYTEEQTLDFQARAKEFEKEFNEFYEGLTKKHECEMVYNVTTVPGPQGIHGLGVSQSIGDLKYKEKEPIKSPFMAKDGESHKED